MIFHHIYLSKTKKKLVTLSDQCEIRKIIKTYINPWNYRLIRLESARYSLHICCTSTIAGCRCLCFRPCNVLLLLQLVPQTMLLFLLFLFCSINSFVVRFIVIGAVDVVSVLVGVAPFVFTAGLTPYTSILRFTSMFLHTPPMGFMALTFFLKIISSMFMFIIASSGPCPWPCALGTCVDQTEREDWWKWRCF